MANLTANEGAFVQGVSAGTGIDPRVLIAWVQSEGHPGDLYNNYLNIAESTAQSLQVPTVGTAAAGTAEFADVQTGIRATIAEMRSLGLGATLAGKTPEQAISQIAASPWAGSHYGGPGGPNLANVFAGDFGGQAGLASPYEGPGSARMITGDINIGGSAASPGLFGSGTILGAPGGLYQGSGAKAVVGGVTSAYDSTVGAIDSVSKALQFVFSYRFAEIVGGVLLILVGLVLLGRQYGASVPGASAVASRMPV